MAVYAIGDLHGCYEPFCRLLEAIRFAPGNDTLWLTGDLVNRGPESLKTLRLVRELGDSVITVLGNHDLHLIALASGASSNRKPSAALKSVLTAPDRDELVDWLRHRPLLHYDEAMDTLLVHAGIYPSWSVRKALARAAEVEAPLTGKHPVDFLANLYGDTPWQWRGTLKGSRRLRFIVNTLTRMRMLTATGRLSFSFAGPPQRARPGQIPWFRYPGNRWGKTRILFGHWSALGLIALPKLLSLDTGCVWGRQLTAIRIDRPVLRICQIPGQTREATT